MFRNETERDECTGELISLFDERWCRLEDGSILFARIADDPVEEEYEEEGYTDYVNFTLLDAGYTERDNDPRTRRPAYETGQFCRKEDWTVSDFADNNWCRPVRFYDIGDPYDLRDLIEYEDWNGVIEYAKAYPDLFSGIIPVFRKLGLM